MSTQDWIKKQLAAAKPITAEQADRIAAALPPVEEINTPGDASIRSDMRSR